jgi:tetratricopeptide (TPR) repeat protein
MAEQDKKELFVVKILNNGLRTKDIATGEYISLNTRVPFKISELDTITFKIEKEWIFKKHKYASGKILDNRLIFSNIKTKTLVYESDGIWDPHESYGNEAEEYFPDYIREGYREAYIFKDYTGYGFYEKDDDPVYNSVELKEYGEEEKAYDLLTKLWQDYPECIDALVHIGSMYFYSELFLHRSYNCYKAAVEIAERGMPEDIDGIFLWICHENRPYLRALNGLYLILWKQKEYEKAYEVATKLLRMCPTDNLGVRFNIEKIKNREKWEEEQENY